MASSRVINPEDRMQQIYLENLEKTVSSLCKLINVLVSEGTLYFYEDQIVFDAYEMVKEILGEIKYFEKFNNKSFTVSKYISQTLSLIETHSEHQSSVEFSKENGLPPVKIFKDLNLKVLTTIAEKESEENLFINYIRKEGNRMEGRKNKKTNQAYSKTINEPVTYLNTSREFEIIREETRKSLDNSGISIKKPLYKDLERFKGNEQIFPAVKDYLDKRNNKKSMGKKNHNYTISKFL